ncbi:uncharacterized protein cubi_02265 [Cryptosporidium ubiquitum]|uniref:Uncharacterized protein n=1 Tax=Cryptosporidium ubiquitum TaxID=857276 RepID=A0A1J4MFJ6_9CRYT|nr:uncharacterized protein cubi_02265 [Cryptosporidium ubiquitum]OII73034.1 hypothetical protein cubi_02265 [Cryptosporidium ubiquitum]
MFFSNRAPIPSPSSNDKITKLQTTLNNILHCLTDALYLLPDLAPKVTSSLQLEEGEELNAAKHDILYRANYISTGFECTNNLISEMRHLKPLNGEKAEIFLEKIEELKAKNENCIRELNNVSEECIIVLDKLNISISKYVEDSINKSIMLSDTENKMNMTLGEIYEINNDARLNSEV